MFPVHDTAGVVDALPSGSLAGLDRLNSATSVDGTASYRYDPTGQLTGASYTNSLLPEKVYFSSYDADGNRETANGSNYVIGADNRLVSDGTYTYSYDAEKIQPRSSSTPPLTACSTLAIRISWSTTGMSAIGSRGSRPMPRSAAIYAGA